MVLPGLRRRGRAAQPRQHRNQARKLASLGAWAAMALSATGCGREFFREWADMDVTEAVFEKTRDPRWKMPLFTIDPPAMSRFADWSDRDRPPAPPDDLAAEALSPYPQKPHMRLMVPMEGTGYLDMLEAGPRYEAPPEEQRPGDPDTTTMPDLEDVPISGDGVPIPSEGAAPLAPGTTPDSPATDSTLPALPNASPPIPDPPIPGRGENPGTGVGVMTPKSVVPKRTVPAQGPAIAASAALKPASPQTRSDRRLSVRDPNLIAATFQVPGDAPTGAPLPGQDPLPVDNDPLRQTPALNPGLPQDVRRELQEQPQEDRDAIARRIDEDTAQFAAALSTVRLEVSQATSAGLPANSRPYMVNPATALQLGLVNNRPYQFRLETVYGSSLAVTLQRFNFEPQFYAGMGPSTQTAGGLPFTGNGNQFVYRTAGFGAQQSQLTLSEAAGFGKLFTYGGRLAAGFASSTVFNFIGTRPQQPSVSSSLPLAFAQPFLRGGGRAVIMEPLTQAERTLLYDVRTFARARQQFFVSMLTSGQADAGGGTNEPNTGYLGVLSLYQQAENERITLAAFERALELYREFARNGDASGITQLQVDQVDQSYRDTQVRLINAQVQYRNANDNFKQQMGLPPDTPLILDLGVIDDFRAVLRDLLRWQVKKGHRPCELLDIVGTLPRLEPIVLDDRPLFEYVREPASADCPDAQPQMRLVARYSDPEKLEEFLLAGERIALENRLDLMNQRAVLYDTWRQLEVTTNALLPVFNVSLGYQLLTPTSTTNPFGFDSQSNLTSLSFNTELPLVRVQERNGFVTALLNYQRSRRLLMFTEDSIKNQIRAAIRNLIFLSESYEIAKPVLINVLRQRDLSLNEIIGQSLLPNPNPAQAAVQTNNFIQSINGVLAQLNNLITRWIAYQSARLALYRDLGTMPYDEWEAYYEFFPQAAGGRPDQPGAGQPAAPGADANDIDVAPAPGVGP